MVTVFNKLKENCLNCKYLDLKCNHYDERLFSDCEHAATEISIELGCIHIDICKNISENSKKQEIDIINR